DGMASPFTFGEWCEKYPKFDDVKRKRSLAVEFRVIDLHLKPFFGACLNGRKRAREVLLLHRTSKRADDHSKQERRYVDLQAGEVADAFVTSQIDKRIDKQKRGAYPK